MSVVFSPKEARQLLRLGLPVFIAQSSQMAMGFVDTAMMGHYSTQAMAAVAVASSVWMPVSLFGWGCLLALTPLSAQYVGAGDARGCVHLLRQGIWLSLGLSVLLMVFFLLLSWHMELLHLDALMAAQAGGYLRGILWGLPGAFFFVNIRSFLEGHSLTRPAMVVGVLALLINIPCNYMLIYGKWGLPELGATGCGMATAIAYWSSALLLLVHVQRSRQFRPLHPFFAPLWQRRSPETRLDFLLLGRVMRIGVPGALALVFEVSTFAVTALLLTPLGSQVVAANQIALNFSSLLFLVPLSISVTSTIRVGSHLGRGAMQEARCSAWTALMLGLGAAIVLAALTVLLRPWIVRLYTEESALVAPVASLLLFTAAYQLLDATQAVGAGVLRAYNDTRIISLICFIGYWLVGLPAGWALAYCPWGGEGWGAAGFWTGFLLALFCCAVGYWARLAYLHRCPAAEIFRIIGR